MTRPSGSNIFVSAKRRRLRWALLVGSMVGTAAFAKDPFPPSPERPWSPPQLRNYEQELAQMSAHAPEVSIDPGKIYQLADLIDLAERNNPETRIAWEHARQAAAAVGLRESAYYPYLAASAAAGYARAFVPFPTLRVSEFPHVQIVGGGTLTTEAAASQVALGLKWLLVDFGARRALVDASKEKLMMANVGFNAAHQKVVFEVTRGYYDLGRARQKVVVARSALDAAQTVERAAKARLDSGLATKTELLQAQQLSAQSAFDLEAATSAESDARIMLVESLGILPTTGLRVADLRDKPVPADTERSIDTLIDKALSQRPDLVAKFADVRAKEAEVREARAEFYPKIGMEAGVAESRLDVAIENSPYFGGAQPTYSVGVKVEVPIFDGFERRQALGIAEAELRASEHELLGARDAVVREVWKARNDFTTALRKQDAAAKLILASEGAYDAVLEAYKGGLSTFVEVANAQRSVAFSRSVGYDTRAAIFTSAAALALSIGDLARPSPARPTQRKR